MSLHVEIDRERIVIFAKDTVSAGRPFLARC